MYKFSVDMFSVFLDILFLPRNCWVTLLFSISFWETANLSETIEPFYIPTSNIWRLQLLHIINTCYCPFLITATLVSVKQHAMVIWICISLMTSEVEHLSWHSLFNVTAAVIHHRAKKEHGWFRNIVLLIYRHVRKTHLESYYLQ